MTTSQGLPPPQFYAGHVPARLTRDASYIHDAETICSYACIENKQAFTDHILYLAQHVITSCMRTGTPFIRLVALGDFTSRRSRDEAKSRAKATKEMARMYKGTAQDVFEHLQKRHQDLSRGFVNQMYAALYNDDSLGKSPVLFASDLINTCIANNDDDNMFLMILITIVIMMHPREIGPKV